MRGGSQAQLLAADDGHCYVTKYINNPQNRRILVNEWIGARLLRELKVAVPETKVVEITLEFLEREPGLQILLADRRIEVQQGYHFGSQFPGDPLTEAVYDFLPEPLLASVVNIDDFRGAFVFDKWTSNSDSRQAIFFRRRIRDWLDLEWIPPTKKGFIVQMVDQGYIFDGASWRFDDSPSQGSSFHAKAMTVVRGLGDFEPWLTRAMEFPESTLHAIRSSVPEPWLERDGGEIEKTIAELYARRQRIPDLLQAERRARPSLFPNWKSWSGPSIAPMTSMLD